MKRKTTIFIIGAVIWSAMLTAAHAQPYEVSEQLDPNINLDSLEFSSQGIQQTVHYASAGDDQRPGIIFIHGTPGSWQAFEVYLSNRSLQKEFFMVSVDRVGWGESQTKDNSDMKSKKIKGIATTFAFQAQAVTEIMQRYPEKKWVLLGHSLGASIAPKIALREQSRVIGVVLLAGSINPKLGKPRWYNRFANTMLLKWMLPENLGYSNDEIMQLRTELELLETQLIDQQLNFEMVVIQGMKDRLVSPKNAKYAQQNWADIFSKLTVLELPEAGHFLPWNETPLVIRTLKGFSATE